MAIKEVMAGQVFEPDRSHKSLHVLGRRPQTKTLVTGLKAAQVSDMPSKSVGGRKPAGGFDSRPPPHLKEACDQPLGEEAVTDREREVLGLIAEGMSNKAIAARVYATERTVEAHVTQIFQKLGLPESPDQHRRVLAVPSRSCAHSRGIGVPLLVCPNAVFGWAQRWLWMCTALINSQVGRSAGPLSLREIAEWLAPTRRASASWEIPERRDALTRSHEPGLRSSADRVPPTGRRPVNRETHSSHSSDSHIGAHRRLYGMEE